MVADERMQDLVPVASSPSTTNMSRRHFLSGAAAGGALGLAVAAGAGLAAGQVSRAQSDAALQARDAEIARLQGLVKLYEDLESVGLDSVLELGMVALALPLGAVESGAKTLQSGLARVEMALDSLRASLPQARDALVWLDAQVEAALDGLQKLGAALGKVLDKVADSPVAESVREFAGVLLDRLPFGLGEKIGDALDGIVQLVTGVEEVVRDARPRVLEPLRGLVGSDEAVAGIGAGLIDAVVSHVLDPLQAHLEALADLADAWQDRLAEPARGALAQRATIRDEIRRYRQQNGIE